MSEHDPFKALQASSEVKLPIIQLDENARFIQELKENLQKRDNQIQELINLAKEQNERIDAKIEQLLDIMIQRYK